MPGRIVQTERSTKVTALSRIGQRRQVVIPKTIFEQLALAEGDFIEVTAEHGRLAMKPKKLVDADNTLTPAEGKKARHALKQLKDKKTRPWGQIKHELGL